MKEAAAWLGYTYLFVRMQKNPLAYGVSWEEVASDPRLEARRRALVIDAARELERCKMARFDERSGHLYITELVRSFCAPVSRLQTCAHVISFVRVHLRGCACACLTGRGGWRRWMGCWLELCKSVSGDPAVLLARLTDCAAVSLSLLPPPSLPVTPFSPPLCT